MASPRDPNWITTCLLLAALLAACAALLVLIGDAAGPGHRHGRLVADITVNLGGLEVREHCTTCHPEGARPDLAKEHPDIAPHSIERLGCTGCHLGEGMALDETISHGLPGLGARSVLKGKDLVASCYTCHPLEPLAGAERAFRGARYFTENACDTCHYLGGLGLGGRFGPDLSTIGSTLGLEAIEEAIREPAKAPSNSTMPRFPLSKGQLQSLTWFLKSRVANPFHSTPMMQRTARDHQPPPSTTLAEALVAEDVDLLRAARCLACHQWGEEDGRIAPDLTFTGSQRDRAYLMDALLHPSRRIPGSLMPVVPLEPEVTSLVVEVLQRPASRSLQGIEPKHLYMHLCQRCHAAAGDGKGLIQPNLANFPRAFANNGDFFRRVEDQRLLHSLAEGIPGTSMPPYGKLLTETQRQEVLDLVFNAFIGIGRGEKLDLSPLPSRPQVVASAEDLRRLFTEHCSRCHGPTGTGKGPEALEHLPRPRNLTNQLYFAALNDQRILRVLADGVPGTAMPAFRGKLDTGTLWGLVDQVRTFAGGRHGD